MAFLTENSYIASSVVQLLAYLVLTLLCLVRLPRAWAVLGTLAGLASMLSTGWYFALTLSLRFSEGPFPSSGFFSSPSAQVVMQLVTALATVLLAVAVLAGRRPAPEEHAGPTGTTFRQLPSGIRWE